MVHSTIAIPHRVRLYAYKLAEKGNTNSAWKAIDICESIAQYIARIYSGKTDCSSAGTVQYYDTVDLTISVACAKQLEKDFPFISITPIDYFF